MKNDEINKPKYIIGELHNVIWRVWNVWKDIAIASHLVIVHRHKRRNIRLSVSIVADKEEQKH